MDAVVYVTVPDGFSEDGGPQKFGDAKVRLLQSGVPGIPQGSYLFHKKVKSVLEAAGATVLPDDASVWKLLVGDDAVYILVWVDDFFVFFPIALMAPARQLWAAMQRNFELPDWKDVDDCPGVKWVAKWMFTQKRNGEYKARIRMQKPEEAVSDDDIPNLVDDPPGNSDSDSEKDGMTVTRDGRTRNEVFENTSLLAHVTFSESHFPLADSTTMEGPRPAFTYADEEEDPAATSP